MKMNLKDNFCADMIPPVSEQIVKDFKFSSISKTKTHKHQKGNNYFYYLLNITTLNITQMFNILYKPYFDSILFHFCHLDFKELTLLFPMGFFLCLSKNVVILSD